MIWKLRAAHYLWTKYHFEWRDARELAQAVYENSYPFYTPKDAVDEEMSYWGD